MSVKVAVLGASGFVGSTFVQRVFSDGDLEIKPFIHSSGNAWSLSRHAIPLHQVDILSKSNLENALQGCTHVVNCTRGSGDVMRQGLRNILECCQRAKIKRFVHLSSVAVYDGSFTGEPITEEYSGRAAKNTYGDKKNLQDQMVEAAHKRGLSSVVLCPPNISGAWSPFLIQLVQLMNDESFALIDEGDAACSLIDVENLVQAIRLALTCDKTDGRRIFVTDEQTPTWSEVAAHLQCLASSKQPVVSIGLEEARQLVRPAPKKKGGLLKSVKHMVSSDVREALRADPWIGSVESVAKGVAKKFPASVQDRLMKSSNGTPRSFKTKPQYSPRPVQQQLRNASYCLDRAKQVLGFEPCVNMAESFEAFRAWYKSTYGLESGFVDLLSVS